MKFECHKRLRDAEVRTQTCGKLFLPKMELLFNLGNANNNAKMFRCYLKKMNIF